MNAPRDKLGYTQKVKPWTAFNSKERKAMKTLPEKQPSAAMYQIELKLAAERTLSKLPPKLQKLIATKINSFGKNPNSIGVEKLSGNKKIDQISLVAYGNIDKVHNELRCLDSCPDWTPAQNLLQPLMLT